jgi:tetratricopeptide (TPR) repeat protein
MTQEDEILELQKELRQNPRSARFTKLAEIYLSRDMIKEAETVITQSLKFHPRSVSGLILLGRVFKLKKMNTEALQPLTQATQLASDNWRAWLELAEAQLELKNGKPALQSFKKVLFLNPTHPMARRAVAKLELLTADEYEDDLFQMKKLPERDEHTTHIKSPQPQWAQPEAALVRTLSYIDALMLRHQTEKALNLLNECSAQYGKHPEIEARRLKLSVFEKPDYLEPKSMANSSQSRRKLVTQKQIEMLKMLLRRIEANKSDLLST